MGLLGFEFRLWVYFLSSFFLYSFAFLLYLSLEFGMVVFAFIFYSFHRVQFCVLRFATARLIIIMEYAVTGGGLTYLELFTLIQYSIYSY